MSSPHLREIQKRKGKRLKGKGMMIVAPQEGRGFYLTHKIWIISRHKRGEVFTFPPTPVLLPLLIKCPFGQYIQDNILEYSIVTGATPNAAVVLFGTLHKGQGLSKSSQVLLLQLMTQTPIS